MEGKVCSKCGVWKPLEEYHKRKTSKDGRRSECKECQKEYRKQHYQNNKECYKEQNKQWREDNKEYRKEYEKQYREKNKDKIRECEKKREENNKNKNIKRIEQLLIMVNPIFAKLNLSVYGYVYKIANVKTNKVYIGQTIYPLNRRYHGNIIKGWIKERKRKTKQKFLGYFPINKPFQAFTCYKAFKEKYIKQVADEYKDIIPQKLYEALYKYEVEIND